MDIHSVLPKDAVASFTIGPSSEQPVKGRM